MMALNLERSTIITLEMEFLDQSPLRKEKLAGALSTCGRQSQYPSISSQNINKCLPISNRQHEYRFVDFSAIISRSGISVLVPKPQ